MNSDICQINANNEISVYSGSLTKECIADSVVKIKKTFPSLTPEFFAIFANRVKENGFSDARLTASVNYVIDNCVYPQPTIAQFISYDKKVKLYTYFEYCTITAENKTPDIMKAVKVAGLSKPMFARVEDIELYNLVLWQK